MKKHTRNWIRQTTLFLTGQTLSLFGSMLVQFAISWHVTITTGSGVQMTIMTLCGFLPQLVISPFAGVWADRYNRKMLLVVSDGVIALSTLALALLYRTGHRELWLLYVVSVIRSLGSGVQTPAVGAFLPEFVPADELMRVNGINAAIQGVMMMAAPLMSGVVCGLFGIEPVLYVDVVTAAAGIGVMLLLNVAHTASGGNKDVSVFEDMKIGLSYVRRTNWLWQFLLFYLIYAVMYTPLVLLTNLMVKRSFAGEAWPLLIRFFGEDHWKLTMHEVVFAVGTLIGGMMLGTIDRRVKNKMHLLMGGCILFGAGTFLLGFSPNFTYYLAVMLAIGVTMPYVNSSTMAILQRKVEPDYMGRVFGLVSIVGSAAMPLSIMIWGPLADVISIETELIITGAAMVLITLVMLRFPEILRAGEMAEPQAEPLI